MQKRNRKPILNQLKTEFSALSVNEGLSRSMVCAMVAQLDISVDALADVRCAVSEAVTNAIVHGYGNPSASDGNENGAGKKTVYILTTLYGDRSVKIIIRDRGCGIGDVARAMQPMFTTDPTGERSGMGFAIMQSFMDSVRVKSVPGKGTTVELRKSFAASPAARRPRQKITAGTSDPVPDAEEDEADEIPDTVPEEVPDAVPDTLPEEPAEAVSAGLSV